MTKKRREERKEREERRMKCREGGWGVREERRAQWSSGKFCKTQPKDAHTQREENTAETAYRAKKIDEVDREGYATYVMRMMMNKCDAVCRRRGSNGTVVGISFVSCDSPPIQQ